MKQKRVMAMEDRLQWLDLEIMTRRMELWGMKAENQKQDCMKGVTEMEKQDSEMENQDLITEEDGLHHINNKNKEKMKMKMNQQEEELQGMSFTYKPMHCWTMSPHLIFGIPCIPPEEEGRIELWGMKAENQKQDCFKGVTEMENQDLITEEDGLHHINNKQKMDSEMETQDLITEMDNLHHINNKNKEQMKMNQQEEEGMSFTYKPMHCLTRSPHLIFGIPSIPPEEEEETSWGIAGLGPRWLI